MAEIWINVNTTTTLPVNLLPLVNDTDFKTVVTVVSASSVHLDWNFIPTAGSQTQTNIPTSTTGSYIWNTVGNGMFSINVPATGGSYINNNTTGFGWFTGSATGVLPWRSPIIGFRAAILNDNLIDDAYGLASASSVFPSYQVIENSITHEQAIKLLLSVLVGTSSGGGTTTQIFNNLLNSGSRVTATTDSNGNRTAVDLNVT